MPETSVAHAVLYQHGGEVVCTCGGYFKTESNLGLTTYPRTGLYFWAQHVRDARADVTPETAWDDGFTACAHEHMAQQVDPRHPITRTNPHATTKAAQ